MNPEPFTLVILGITSNLATTKLIPALYDLEDKGHLIRGTKILGVARGERNPEEFESFFHQTLHLENRHHKHSLKDHHLKNLYQKLHFLPGNINDPNFYHQLKEKLTHLKSKNLIFYLATYPDLYKTVFEGLRKAHLNRNPNGFSRVIIEKPIGNDLKSAKKLNTLISKYFKQDQVFRLDHYLGKETIQNILTFRSQNLIFESLMNKNFIDHIQVTSSEDFGIKDRGGYYDSVGCLKDVGQNHILQMLAFALMDLPKKFTNQSITSERFKLIKSLTPDPKKIVFGQYEGYLNEKNIGLGSKTDTFFALKTSIKNSRFRGVPIYIRAGKNLASWVTEISIVFNPPAGGPHLPHHPSLPNPPNILIYRIQPNQGIILKITTKKPGSKSEVEDSYMQFCYHHLSTDLPDAYEKLLVDAIEGDQTFFNDSLEIEAQWKFTDPLIKAKKRLPIYKKGSWGPMTAEDLIKKDGRVWLEPSNLFCNF